MSDTDVLCQIIVTRIPDNVIMLRYRDVCLPLKPGNFQQTRVPNSLPMGANYVDYEPQGTEVIPVYLKFTPRRVAAMVKHYTRITH